MGNLFVEDKDIVVSKSPFSTYEGEKRKFDGRKTNISTDHIMIKVKREDVFGVDYDIIKAIYDLHFSTSRMITQHLNLKGIDIDQSKVQNRLNFLNRLNIISRYKIVNDETVANTRFYCLENMGRVLLLSRDYKCHWKQTDSAVDLKKMKTVLARNQVLLTYRKKLKSIESYRDSDILDGNINPDLEIIINGKNDKKNKMWFVVERSYEGWEDNIERKLRFFKSYLDNYKPKQGFTSPPAVVIVGEDDRHLFEVFKIILKEKLNPVESFFLYTSDLRVISKDIDKSLIEFTLEKDKGKYKPKIKELTYDLLKS